MQAELDKYGRPLPSRQDGKLVPFLTTDAVVIRRTADASNPEILLITRGHAPDVGKYALPGGHNDYNEDPKDCVLRELREETGLIGQLGQLITVHGHPERDARGHRVSIVYAVYVDEKAEPVAGDDAATAAFYPIKSVLEKPESFAFDHAQIVQEAYELIAGKK
jgi:8-oxo-dGTP diphosphatase